MTSKKLAAALAAAAVCIAPLGAALASAGAADAAPAKLAKTVKTVVRPVHANGKPVAGWKVSNEEIGQFSCEGASTSAVDPNIEFCGFSATYTPSCWKSTKHTVLCLRSATDKRLVRIKYVGSFAPAKPFTHPVPQDMTLTTGNSCSIRDGGAASRIKGHPDWYFSYYCAKNTAIVGPAKNNGIDTSVNPWKVHQIGYLNNGQQHIVTRRVQRAYYVGTAA